MSLSVFFTALKKVGELFIVLLSNPKITLRLITITRIMNAFRVVFLRQGNLGLLLQRYRDICSVTSAKVDDSMLRRAESRAVDILFFPAIDWGFRFQRPQHIARELGALGYRVFYVSTVPLLIPSQKNYLIQGTPEAGVVLVQLYSGSKRIPDFYSEEMTAIEIASYIESCNVLREDFEIDKITLLIQQPFWWPFVKHLKAEKLVYDCLDHHVGFHEVPKSSLINYEQELINSADAVVATSIELAEAIKQSRECHLIRNACEFSRFSKIARVKSKVSQVIGYVGAVSEWFDGKLLFDVASARPNWQFDIYGAVVNANVSACRTLPNIKFLGEVPYEMVPNLVTNFDVCIIPFKLNALTLATNPVKVYEYLACGRPVVSTNLPELAYMENIDVYCAESAKDFISKIEIALECSNNSERIRLRQDFASKNDWSARVSQLEKFLQPEFAD